MLDVVSAPWQRPRRRPWAPAGTYPPSMKRLLGPLRTEQPGHWSTSCSTWQTAQAADTAIVTAMYTGHRRPGGRGRPRPTANSACSPARPGANDPAGPQQTDLRRTGQRHRHRHHQRQQRRPRRRGGVPIERGPVYNTSSELLADEPARPVPRTGATWATASAAPSSSTWPPCRATPRAAAGCAWVACPSTTCASAPAACCRTA